MFHPSMEYTFFITAVNQDFHGDKSEPTSIIYDPDSILSKIKDVRISDTGDGRIAVNWNKAGGDVKQYLVQLKSSNPFDFGNQEFVTNNYDGK